MEFEWDENKNSLNIAKHKVDFSDALYVFLDAKRVERIDSRRSYGEERWQTVGMTEQGILFIVYTERVPGKLIRLISARKANTNEQRAYARRYFAPYKNEASL